MVDGLTIAARYRAGSVRAAVGGDWYDVVDLDDDRVALLVGDVVGHGMEAAVAMGRLRTGFRMIAALQPRARRHGAGGEPAGGGDPERACAPP